MHIDILLTGGQVYNSYLKKFIPSNIAVSGDRFAYVGMDELPLTPRCTVDLAGQ